MKATFRTEFPNDLNIAIELLIRLKVTHITARYNYHPKTGYAIVTIDYSSFDTFDILKHEMTNLVECDKRFIILRKCYQTLAIGEHPSSM